MITFIQLRCFLAIVDEMDFRRAAEQLNMTQPPLTRHIQALEHALDFDLFDRGCRSIRLTPAGAAFARSARLIVGQTNAAVIDARRIASGDEGSLTIGFTAASSYQFLPRFVKLLRERMPSVSLTLREMTSAQQLDALRLQQIDIGLSRPPILERGVRSVCVFREPLVLAVAKEHRLSQRPSVTVADLAGESLITYPPVEGAYFHGLVTGLLQAMNVRVAETQHVTQTHSILALVGADLGVALVPRSAESIHFDNVIFRPLVEAHAVNVELVLAWRDDTGNPVSETALRYLTEFFSTAARSLP